jgi:tyrosinase
MPLAPTVVATKIAFAKTAFFSNVEGEGPMTFGGGNTGARRPHSPNGDGEGQIEMQPHNVLHGAVGNGTNQSMSNPAGAGLDPVFWPVHAEIDRAWSCWQGNNKGSEPESDTWLKAATFTFFDVKTNTDGSLTAIPVKMTGSQIIDTAKNLGYKYDNDCKGFQVPKPPKNDEVAQSLSVASAGSPLSAVAESPMVLASEPVTVAIDLPRDVEDRIEALVEAGAPEGAIRLTVGGLAVDTLTGAAYEIYLNLPEGAVPDYNSEYYLGNLSFFGVGYHHHGYAEREKAGSVDHRATYDVTDAVRQLISSGEWRRDQLSVSFVNNAADNHTTVEPPAALPGDRARFAYLRLTVY